MRMGSLAAAAFATAALACTREQSPVTVAPYAGETHLANIRQLTFGGENAEAYFSADGTQLIFQSTRGGRTSDQQFIMNIDGSNVHRVSTGAGKTTCGYFFANDRKIFFASTHAVDTACSPKPDPSKGYVWRLDPYDIYTANADGSDLARITHNGVYTAEGTLSPDGQTIVFTSLKDGDLDIYTMKTDGGDVKRLTSTPGYDGGAFFSPDGRKIVYRAWHAADTALTNYQALLRQGLVRPNRMEIWVMNADGSDQHQVTALGGANFAPYFTPDGRHIIFASNDKDPHSRNFDLYVVNLDGSGLEQITTYPEFDGFPMFSPNGKQLVWASDRHGEKLGETDIFIADWVP